MDSLGCSVVSLPVVAKRVFIPTDDVPSTLRGQNKEQPLFTLFPNPNNGAFILKSDDLVDGAFSLFIYDLYGRIVHQSMLITIEGKLSEEIVLNGIADGIYTLQLKSPSNSDLIPLLISR